MRIYISGPITNDPNYITRFWITEMRLKERFSRSQIFNPASAHEKMPDWMKHRQYMELCQIELRWCDTAYFMRGWETSKGCRMEHEWAKEWGMKIIEEGEDDNTENGQREADEDP